jgi:two-component system response regulator
MSEAVQILLAEDNLGDVRLISRGLKDFPVPYDLHVVHDGEQALKFMNREGDYAKMPPINLVLLDWNLPRLHGREVLEHIKRSERLKHIPVVVLTTSEATGDVVEAYTRFANCYITKPLELADYLKTIQDLERFWLTCAKLPIGQS